MNRFLLLIFILLTACNIPTGVSMGETVGQGRSDGITVSVPTDAPDNSSQLPLPPTIVPTDVPPSADGTALAFYRSWELGRYEDMYSLLSNESKQFVTLEQFRELYVRATDEARVSEVTSQAIGADQVGGEANFAMRVAWESPVLGTIERDHVVPLVFEGGRWGIVWSEGLIMPELEGGNRLNLVVTTPARATVYDREDRVLTFEGSGIQIGVVPERLEDEQGFLNAMSALLGEPADDVQERYINTPANWYVPLGMVQNNELTQNFGLIEPFLEAGLVTNEGRGRMINVERIAPHLMGFMQDIPPERLADYQARGYTGTERVGVAGLELLGESYLAGSKGGSLNLLSLEGDVVRTIFESETRQGRNVHATFDADFQLDVQKALEEAVNSHPDGWAGAAVVLDVNSGAVLAMASYPTFDASIFSELRPDRSQAIADLQQVGGNPQLNRAVLGQYPPGSTFKIATFSAALQSGQYTPDTPYSCIGSWNKLGANDVKYDWLLTGHGNVTIMDGLTRSCNTYSYDIGYTLDFSDPYLLPNVAREFGLGKATGIEGVFEAEGVIPDPDWKLANLGDGWSTGDAVNMAIGQGFVLATPLQIANMTATVANGGTVYQPRLLHRIEGTDSEPEIVFPPVEAGKLSLSADQVKAVQLAMNDVTSGSFGTAANRMEGLQISTAGKTGTAQVPGENTLPHSWFTGYAPFESPEIAVAIIIENAGEGSAVSAPIFRRIIELYYGQETTPFWWQE